MSTMYNPPYQVAQYPYGYEHVSSYQQNYNSNTTHISYGMPMEIINQPHVQNNFNVGSQPVHGNPMIASTPEMSSQQMPNYGQGARPNTADSMAWTLSQQQQQQQQPQQHQISMEVPVSMPRVFQALCHRCIPPPGYYPVPIAQPSDWSYPPNYNNSAAPTNWNMPVNPAWQNQTTSNFNIDTRPGFVLPPTPPMDNPTKQLLNYENSTPETPVNSPEDTSAPQNRPSPHYEMVSPVAKQSDTKTQDLSTYDQSFPDKLTSKTPRKTNSSEQPITRKRPLSNNQVQPNVHTPEANKPVQTNPDKCECPNCVDKYGNQIVNQNEKQRSHLCHYCSKSYKNVPELKAHLREHTGETPFVREAEDKPRTDNIGNRKQFQRQWRPHNGDKKFVCQQWPKKPKMGAEFNQHKKSHGNSKTNGRTKNPKNAN